MNEQKQGFFSNLSSDLPASIVVFLVAVPLCLGIALASGTPLFSGIIAGIVGGIVVSLVSKSPLGVSGPAAGLVAIVLSALDELGTFEIFLCAVLLSGVLQIILGMLKAGVIAYFFPSSVIKGMLSGIGIIIILKQIPHAFGYDKDPEGDLSFTQVDGHNTFSEFWYMLDYISPLAIGIAVVSMIILILWEQPFMKKMSFTKIVQGPLVVVITGIVMNLVFADSSFHLNADQVVKLPIADSFAGFTSMFTMPDFTGFTNINVYKIAFTIAVVASIETLLCVEATDKLDPQKRVTPTNRELFAQGTGNIVSGLIGGLPVTQVIVRSSANIQSGGKTRASAFFHGVLMLACVLLIPGVLNMVPYASLAAILFMVGYKLAKPQIFKDIMALGKSEFIPFTVTILGIVFIDLLWGIGLGLVVAFFFILYNNFRTPYHDVEINGGDHLITLSEDVSFLNKAGILKTLADLPNDIVVTIDASRTKTIHPDVVEIIDDFCATAENRNIDLNLINFDHLHEVGWLKSSR